MAFCTNCGGKVSGAFCPQCGAPANQAGQPAPAAPQMTPPMTPPPAYPPSGAPMMQPPPAAPMMQPPPGAYPPQGMQMMPPPPPGARKTSPLVWILVIVLGLFLLGGIGVVGTGLFVAHKMKQAGFDTDLMARNPGLAISKMVVAANPDLDVVSHDDGAGTITVRDRKTGKIVTMSFDDVKNGKFHVSATGDDGKTATLDFGGANSKLPDWVPSYPGSQPKANITASSDGSTGGNFTFTTSDSPTQVLNFYRDKLKDMGMKVNFTTVGDNGGSVGGSDEGDTRNLMVTVGGGAVTGVNITYSLKQ